MTDRWTRCQRMVGELWPKLGTWVREHPSEASGDLGDATACAIRDLGLLPCGARKSEVFDTRVLVRVGIAVARDEQSGQRPRGKA